MTLTTPALLFSAISLLLLAYTNRFTVLAQLIRQLHKENRDEVHDTVVRQIKSLSRRIQLTKAMQAFGVLSFLFCTLSMLALFLSAETAGKIAFGLSLICLTLSLFISFWEIQISGDAIQVELEDMKKELD